jgi:glycosyltransferase involved in cell wall biosynthesis/O-antigen/teichoic acid export membrane protein
VTADKIRILLLIDRLLPGGTEKQLLALAERLPRDSFEPVIGVLVKTAYQESLSLSTQIVSFEQHGARFLKTFKLIRQLRKYIEKEKFDIVQTHFEDSSILGAIATRLIRQRPCLIGTRRNLYHWIREQPWIFKVYKLAGRFADVILANSYSVADRCRVLESAGKDKVVVIQNGIDIRSYRGASKEAARERLGIHSAGPVIGVIGNWRPVKGQVDFLRAAPSVLRQCPGATFVLAGFGPQKRELQKMAEDLGISERSIFIEGCMDSLLLVSALDIAVQPSLSESFSNVLIEYMAAGHPVVATRVGDAERIIDHGKDGLLVDPGNSAQLGAAIVELCQNGERAAQLGKSAQSKVAARWSMENLIEEHIALYKRMVATMKVVISEQPNRNSLPNTDSPLRREILSIGRHSVWYLIAQALSRAVGFFMIPIYTRFIAPTNYGAMELIEILANGAALIVAMGVTDIMAKFYYAQKTEEGRRSVVSTVVIGFSVVALPITLAFVLSANYLSSLVAEEEKFSYYLQISFLATWFGMLSEIGLTYLRMLYQARLFLVVSMSQLIAALALNVYFVVYARLDILGIFYSTLIVQGITGVAFLVAILTRVGVKISWKMLKDLIALGLPLVPSRIGIMLGFASNRFFLRWLTPGGTTVALGEVGLFSLGHKFGLIINSMINSPFNSFWVPRRFELLHSDNEHARETVARVCTYATLLAVFSGLMLSAVVENVIEIIADPAYKQAYTVVPFVVLAYIALGLETHFMSGMLQAGKTARATYYGAIGLGVVLLWNYLFIPKYGIYGAATANLAGFALRSTLIYHASQRFYRIPFELRRLVIMLLLAAALYAVSQMIRLDSAYVTLCARMAVALLYPLALYVVGFFNTGEVEFIQGLRRRGTQWIAAQLMRIKR